MTDNSMLAAVHAAANETAFAGDVAGKGTAPEAGSQQTEIPMAENTTAAATQPKTDTVSDLKAAYPTLCAEIAADGAKLERERIQGILSLPARGHEKIVTAAIGDTSMTKAEVALHILEAEKTTRQKQMQNLQDVEAEAAKVPASPSAGGAQMQTTFPQTMDGWKAEWNAAAADSDLRADFPTADHYAQYQQGVADGRIRILKTKSA